MYMAKQSPWIKHVMATRKSMPNGTKFKAVLKAGALRPGKAHLEVLPSPQLRRPSAPDAVPPEKSRKVRRAEADAERNPVHPAESLAKVPVPPINFSQ